LPVFIRRLMSHIWSIDIKLILIYTCDLLSSCRWDEMEFQPMDERRHVWMILKKAKMNWTNLLRNLLIRNWYLEILTVLSAVDYIYDVLMIHFYDVDSHKLPLIDRKTMEKIFQDTSHPKMGGMLNVEGNLTQQKSWNLSFSTLTKLERKKYLTIKIFSCSLWWF
jgi:hypothetical protein